MLLTLKRRKLLIRSAFPKLAFLCVAVFSQLGDLKWIVLAQQQGPVRAQEPLRPVQAVGPTNAPPEADSSSLEATTHEELAESFDERTTTIWNLGDLDLRSTVIYDVRHNDNVFAGQGFEEISDVIHQLSTRLNLSLSPFSDFGIGSSPMEFDFTYLPTAVFFQDLGDQDTVNHYASVSLGQAFRRLSVSATGSFLDTQDLLVEAGSRFPRKNHLGRIDLRYDLTGKTDLSTTLAIDDRDFTRQINTRQWRSLNWIDYLASGKVTVGLGAGVGYNEVDGNPNFMTEDALARIEYRPTGKLIATINGGVQFRQLRGGGNESDVSPIFEANLTWLARQNTLLTVSGGRQVAASNFVFANIEEVLQFSGNIQQRLLDKFTIEASGGFGNVESQSTVLTIARAAARDYYFAQASISYQFKNRTKLGVVARRSSRTGNAVINEAVMNEFGVNLSYSF